MLLSLFDMICDKVSLTCCHIYNLFFPSLVLTRWSVCRCSFGERRSLGRLMNHILGWSVVVYFGSEVECLDKKESYKNSTNFY